MATTRLLSKPPEAGSLVHVRFLDHCWFRNTDPRLAKPILQDAWGLLDHVDADYIRLIATTYTDPTAKEDANKGTGLVIVRSTILELKRLD